MKKDYRVPKLLVYAGALPFVVLTLLALSDVSSKYFQPSSALKLYALAIGSFVCGSHWGVYLLKNLPINLFITSNIFTILLWVTFMLVENYEFIYSGILLLLLFIDYFLLKTNVISKEYFKIRKAITVVVVACLMFHLILKK